jgi:hypothetical protein
MASLTWESIYQLALVLIELAKELAIGEGLSSEEYDAKISALEKDRAAETTAIIDRLKGLLS